MARIVTTEIVSDLSGRKNAKEVEFYFEGDKYRIALAGAEVSNFTRMMESIEAKMARYTDVAEKIGTVTGQGTAANKISGKYPSFDKKVRAWALANDYDVARTGRIPYWVYESYNKAHADPVND